MKFVFHDGFMYTECIFHLMVYPGTVT